MPALQHRGADAPGLAATELAAAAPDANPPTQGAAGNAPAGLSQAARQQPSTRGATACENGADAIGLRGRHDRRV